MRLARTARSYVPFGLEHLERLSALAAEDRRRFLVRYPEYRTRLLLVVLAQGAAQHLVDDRTGVKDLDVWTFFSTIPGQRFPADRRETHADFGPSAFGRQLYDYEGASPY